MHARQAENSTGLTSSAAAAASAAEVCFWLTRILAFRNDSDTNSHCCSPLYAGWIVEGRMGCHGSQIYSFRKVLWPNAAATRRHQHFCNSCTSMLHQSMVLQQKCNQKAYCRI